MNWAMSMKHVSGIVPTRISQLVQEGLLRGVPVDPLGFPYELGDDGKAHLNAKSPLLEKQKQFAQFK